MNRFAIAFGSLFGFAKRLPDGGSWLAVLAIGAGLLLYFPIAGDVIAHAGEPASSMHFIVEGRVNIIVPSDDGRVMRVRSLGRFTTVGEMGMVSGRPRSATIEADTDSTLYALPADQFESIKAEHPELAQALLVYFMSVMAERLGFANRTISALRR